MTQKTVKLIGAQYEKGDIKKLIDTYGFDKNEVTTSLSNLRGMTKALKAEETRFVENYFPGNYIPDAQELAHARVDADAHVMEDDTILAVADAYLADKKADISITITVK